MTTQAAPKLFRIRTEADFDRIPFDNGMAAVEVPAHLLDHIDMRDFDRGDSGRLSALLRSIRSNGYNPVEPIHVRIGRRGRWVVIDGGHRLTAARRVMREWLPNLFGKKVENFYFVLFLTPESWSRVGVPEGIDLPEDDPVAVTATQDSWSRADARRNPRG